MERNPSERNAFEPNESTELAWEVQSFMRSYRNAEYDSQQQQFVLNQARTKFDQLTALTYPRIYAAALKRLAYNHDDANDVVQMTYERAYNKVLSYKGQCQFDTWLYKIMLNRVASHYQNQSKRLMRETDLEEDVYQIHPDMAASMSVQPEIHYDQVHVSEDLIEALHALKPKVRTAIWLHHVVGIAHVEIAERLGLTAGATRVQVHRGMQALRAKLHEGRSNQGL